MMQSYDVARGDLGQFGARLKQAREAAGLSLDQVSARLHIPRHVVEALESGDHARLGAPVFVRGQLRSYARLLDLDLQPELDAIPAANEPAPLVSHVHVPRYRWWLEQATRRAVYVVLTAAIAVPVWLATRSHLDRDVAVQSLDVPPVPADAPAAGAARPAAPAPAPAERTPVVASLTALPPVESSREIVVTFNGESWFEAQGADGRTLERGLVAAGQTRRYRAGEVGDLVIGNVSAVDVRHQGRAVDLAPFSRANVARFTLSSDGSLAPVGN